jgi:hypothetical protein
MFDRPVAMALPQGRSAVASRAVRVLEEILGARRGQLLHDVWVVRSLFATVHGPFRRAGFAARMVVPAAVSEMDRVGALHLDPIDEAFWLLAEQRRMLNAEVVEDRATRALFANLSRLRPSQRRAVRRLLAARTACAAHPEGSPASNLLLLAVLAGGLAAAEGTPSYLAAVSARFPGGPPARQLDEVSALVLAPEERARLDERAHLLDLSARTGG